MATLAYARVRAFQLVETVFWPDKNTRFTAQCQITLQFSFQDQVHDLFVSMLSDSADFFAGRGVSFREKWRLASPAALGVPPALDGADALLHLPQRRISLPPARTPSQAWSGLRRPEDRHLPLHESRQQDCAGTHLFSCSHTDRVTWRDLFPLRFCLLRDFSVFMKAL